MLTTAGLISWARSHATLLEADMIFQRGDSGYGWWWKATSPDAESKIKTRAYTALYFLDRFVSTEGEN